MFENGYPAQWTTLKKLIWLFYSSVGGSGTTTTVKGTSPLTLANAIAKKILRLIQFGKCTVSGTDITCNNGVLKYDSELGIYTDGTPEEIRVTGKNVLDPTLLKNQASWNTGTIQLKANTTYTASSNCDSSIVLFYIANNSGGFSSSVQVYNGHPVTITTDADGIIKFQQRLPSSGSVSDYWYQLEEGSTATEYAPFHQETATASNLFAVGSVADEQDIISGTITRRCEAVVSDGSTPSGRYIGTVGEGNIIVQTKETGYSGAIASFTADKAEPLSGLVAEINPVQDMHGQDAPYPAGGGKNKLPYPYFDSSKTARGITFTVGSDGAVKVSGTSTAVVSLELMHLATNNYSGMIISGSPSGSTVNDAAIAVQYWNGGAFSSSAFETGNGLTLTESDQIIVLIRVASGATIDKTFYPMIRASGTDATFQPYSNICPISGWTGAQGQRTGKNLYPHQTVAVYDYNFAVQDTFANAKNPVFLKGGVTYTLTIDSGNKLYRLRGFDLDKSYISNIGDVLGCVSGQSSGFTVYDNYHFYGYSNPTASNNVCVLTPSEDLWLDFVTQSTASTQNQLEVGSTATAYEEFQGEPISVSFPDSAGTVYGGSDEIVGGTLLVDKLITDFDEDRTYYEDQNRPGVFYFGISGRQPVTPTTDSPIIACSVYKVNNVFVTTDEDCYISGTQSYGGGSAFFRDTRLAGKTSEEVKQALAGQKIVFVSGSPQTYTHEGQEVDTLVGQNNVWVDTGDVTAYVPDFTTEQVAGQSLSTTEGTNTVFVTSNVDPVELEVEYKAAE